jgi:pyridoxal phosphate enzyme (YggS family)
MSFISDNLANVKFAIANAAKKTGRDPAEVALVAVSKAHEPELVREAAEAGQMLFAENRVQEARAKIPLCPSGLQWHFIGHLQKNKVRQILPLVDMIEGIDSLAIAQDLNRIAGELGLFPRVLLEVNVAGEGSKFGFTPDALCSDIEELLALDRLEICGLMAIPPFTVEPEQARPYFSKLRELRDRLQCECNLQLPELSMGMSNDYPIAIEEGATMVRVGTAIFGARKGKTWKPSAEEMD